MNNAVIYIGKYSPVFMGILDTCVQNKFKNFIFIETSPYKSSLTKGLCNAHFHIKELGDIHDKLLKLSKEYSLVFCFTLSYNDTLNLHKLKHQADNIKVLGASADCIDILLNKEKMNDFAEQAGLPLLPTVNVTGKNVASFFPLVLRPKDENNATFKAEYVNNNKVLQSFLSIDVVAQPFISGPTIVIHITKFTSDFTFECFIAKNKFEGVTLTLEKHLLNDDLLISQIELFLELTNFSGVGHFEFIQDDLNSKCYFLDFNGRFGGTSLKAATLGFDEFSQYLSYLMPTIFKKKAHTNSIIVSNTLALLKCIKILITKEKSILDYPQKSKLTYSLYLLYILIIGKNELNFPTWPINKDYLVNLIKRKLKR
jgi:hypothetical protein